MNDITKSMFESQQHKAQPTPLLASKDISLSFPKEIDETLVKLKSYQETLTRQISDLEQYRNLNSDVIDMLEERKLEWERKSEKKDLPHGEHDKFFKMSEEDELEYYLGAYNSEYKFTTTKPRDKAHRYYCTHKCTQEEFENWMKEQGISYEVN